MKTRLSTTAASLRIFCAVVLLSLGFGHQPVSAAAPAEAYSEIYRLPDGTFADICSEGNHLVARHWGGHGHEKSGAKPVCEVCLLSASVILPPPQDDVWLCGATVSLDNARRHVVQRLGTSAVVRPKSRAPPVSA